MLSLFDNFSEENLLQKYLMVEIAEAFYAFKIEFVREVIPMIEMFTIESLENNISGLVNLRGETIPVYDLSGFLGKKALEVDISQKLLILAVDNVKFAIIISNVGDIVDISPEDISHLSYNLSINFLNTTVINDKTVIIVDADAFYSYSHQAQNVNKISSNALMPFGGANVDKIKNRTALLNKDMSYNLSVDTFFNERFIIFRLDEEFYSFNISYIKEIKKFPIAAISKIPCVPEFVIGIVNFRGDYIPVLDIKNFLHIEMSPLKDKIEVVILKINNMKLGILVDEILDITNLPIATINPENNSPDSYIIGELVYKENKILNMLNVEKLFSSENMSIENYE